MPDQFLPDPRYEDETTRNFLAIHPGGAANIVCTTWEQFLYLLVPLGFLVVFAWDWLRFGHLLHFFCSFYIFIILFRLATVILSLFGKPEYRATDAELSGLKDADCPRYVILVPLYREPEVATKIVRNLRRLDYPPDKLEVRLLLEADDELTAKALSAQPLPANFVAQSIPPTLPRTKPKACNWGLKEARGDFLVIYDAEDRPDPDQLKKSVLAFRQVPAQVACLQAKLSYYNPRQNWLTRWFTMEYAAWFDLYLPGLHRLGCPIPLGGTSNHFRLPVLKAIGGWDPFNVAEDCDLGIRLHRLGYRTGMLDSTTWEEANSRVGNWIRQRSRWVKGYLQTHLVHCRRPWALLKELGPFGTLSFLVTVGGHSLMLLLNPFFWAFALVYLALLGGDVLAGHGAWEVITSQVENAGAWRMLFNDLNADQFENNLSLFFFVITAILFLANLLFIGINGLGCLKRRLGGIFPALAALSPLYWVLISVGAWKGFWQLVTRPFYWEKTTHGLFQGQEAEAPSPPGGGAP